MQIKDKLKPALPHLIAVLIFIVVSFVYFYPVLEGKVLKANDSTVSKINSKEIQDFRDKHDREPLWTNSIFSGMPAYLISTKYPGNLIKHADTVLRIFKMPVSVLFLSMLGFYILLLIFGVNSWLAIAGAIAYGFSSFFFQVLVAGHNTQAIALAYMAPMIGGIYYAYRHDALKGALLTALFLSLEIQANHPQITYYALMCLLIFGIVEFIYSWKNSTVIKFLKTSALLIIPFIIAIGVNFASLYTTYEYGKYSIRGKSDLVSENSNITSGLNKDYITTWSYGVDETFNLLIPNYKGGASRPFDRNSETYRALSKNNNQSAAEQFQKYWGTQPGTDGPHYVGAIVFFLFILGLILIKGSEKWWLLAATILSIMLSWGKNFMPFSNLFIEYFPGYNKFRAVTMILVISEFCIPLLGFLALRDIFNGTTTKKDIIRGLKIAAGITVGFLLLILIFPGFAGSFISLNEADLPTWLKDALITDRKGLLRSDALRSLAFILLSAGIIIAFISEKVKKEYAILIIALLIVLDLWTVDKRYLDADRFERQSAIQKSFTPTVADAFILKDPSQHRVLNLGVSPFNDNSPTSFFHKSIGGYHGAKMERYQELIDSCIFPELAAFGGAAKKAPQSLEGLQTAFNDTPTPVLNMLNAKYVIFEVTYPPLINPKALGNAWFVEKPVLAENANKEMSLMNSFNPSKEVIIGDSFKNQITKPSFPVLENEKIELVSYQPDELHYKYSAREEKLAVFSEIYYPAGWKCYIDGKESSYFRVDWTLRGMVVPAGDHEIKFTFRPVSYYTGNTVSLTSSILLILLFAGYFFSKFYRKNITENLSQNSMVHHAVCPLCSSEKIALHLSCKDHLLSRNDFAIIKCSDCGFLFTQDYPEESEIGAFYVSEEYISHSDTSKGLSNKLYQIARTIMLSRKKVLVEKITGLKIGKILDIGSGTGYFATTMKRAGWQTRGIEINEKTRNFSITNFGLEVDPPERITGYESNSFDCITLWHVLEHFHDPFKYISEICRLLKPGAVCVVALPNCISYDANHYKRFWAAWDVPRHLWHFNPATVRLFSEKSGFILENLKILPLDVFYISQLSEKYRGSALPFVKGISKAIFFACLSVFIREKSSSLVYIMRKPIK